MFSCARALVVQIDAELCTGYNTFFWLHVLIYFIVLCCWDLVGARYKEAAYVLTLEVEGVVDCLGPIYLLCWE